MSERPELRYEIGDTVWLYMPHHTGEKSRGKVVHVFRLDWGPEFYVVEIDTHIDPVLEVRDWFSLADAKNGPIGLFKRAAKRDLTENSR